MEGLSPRSDECCTPAVPVTTSQLAQLKLLPRSPRHLYSPIDDTVDRGLLEPLKRLSSRRRPPPDSEHESSADPSAPLLAGAGSPTCLGVMTPGRPDECTFLGLGSDAPQRLPEVDTIPLLTKRLDLSFSDPDNWRTDVSDSEPPAKGEKPEGVCLADDVLYLTVEPKRKQPGTRERNRYPDTRQTPCYRRDARSPSACSHSVSSRMDSDAAPCSPFGVYTVLCTNIRPVPDILGRGELPRLENASSCLDTGDISHFMQGEEGLHIQK
ncbi:hypothetical protein GMRT_14901 [Giardia muris]|uniref:Uncharacterized protein n=1 Tax=Giardia muris TaxID=5742 RepID=A0A4Z1T373_GIAMU|nr:hypothetical protein GMRT_14901 [Giardia muris]|eukprot:TNJ27009.1 hypothetical protein GMRT_14901 [Giardia muris]